MFSISLCGVFFSYKRQATRIKRKKKNKKNDEI